MRIAFYIESQGAGGRRDGALLRVKAPDSSAIRSISGISASRLRPGAAPSLGVCATGSRCCICRGSSGWWV
ncbi:hypothetical protein J2T58_002148 [Methanocalculus alkaliphilus]|uniref:hypothetical protein n=1 Tax=Methanocalculus alkaliphilus TaxID=768730 RepID=UPI0020A0B7CB|nr:hypothetical protein [Methanocalculus alkaliphilus]MCP1716272.1 hypothetical protein [Methanocalculus alkaliphilus]